MKCFRLSEMQLHDKLLFTESQQKCFALHSVELFTYSEVGNKNNFIIQTAHM